MTLYPRLSLLLVCLLLVCCDTFTDKKDSNTLPTIEVQNKNETALLQHQYLINGQTFSEDLKTVYLNKVENGTSSIIDSVTVIDKQFHFKGIIKNPDYFSLSSNLSNNKFRFLLDASKIDVFLNEAIENSSSYSSTPLQKAFTIYSKTMYDFRNKGVDLYYNLKGDFSNKNINTLKKERTKLFAETSQYTAQFIKEHPDNYLTALLIRDNLDFFHHKKIREFYNTLSPELKALAFVQSLDTAITKKENVVSQPIPATTEIVSKTTKEYRPKAYGFSGKNQYGELQSLQSIPKGKVVLLDFWASWCAPCRATNPNLVKLHNKYNKDGLEIMSISEDKGEAEWRSAISADNLHWNYHIIDKNKAIAFRYGVESIPFKLLIDKNGRIASEKISGNKLEQRIKELLAE